MRFQTQLTIWSLSLSAVFALAGSWPAWADETLKGRVEDTQNSGNRMQGGALQDELEAKLDQVELQGGAKGNGLQGSVQGNGLQGGVGSQGSGPMQGSVDANPTPINLSAVNDPDAAERELQIDWDRWRNTLTHAIQQGTIDNINVHNDVNFVLDPAKQMMVSRYPVGIYAQYSIDVLPDQKIINIRLLQSSGWPGYDQAVMQSIMNLQGAKLLRYPKGSKRQIVNQQASVRTQMDAQFQNFKFGDVETQRQQIMPQQPMQ